MGVSGKEKCTTQVLPDASEMDHETKLWSELPVDAWKQSVLNEDSVFHELYKDTRRRLVEACASHSYDVIVEVGCGTGEVISHLQDAGVPRIGIDINELFIRHCREDYADQQDLEFHLCDATKLDIWWKESGFDKLYHAPLLVCPNNTIMIMPEGIREEVIMKMQAVAGTEGRCLITFWNGKMFAHGVMGFYKKNADLCGDFDLTPKHINWEEGTIETTTKYKSTWLTAEEIQRWFHSLLIDVELAEPQVAKTIEIDHVAEYGMGVYAWVKGVGDKDNDASASARDYYDSKDAQTFYQTIWGQHNTHIGRYDLVEADPNLAKLPLVEKIRKAQELQEEELMKEIKKHYGDVKVRCLDMGCGYGGLLRTMAQRGMLWSGVGVDISGEMIDACRRLTQEKLSDYDIQPNFRRESYMNTSVQDEGMDLCISMEAFLHVGPGQHEAVLAEAWRVLRPGGRLIFTDILSKPDAPPEAQQLYDRIGLKSFGTVQGYFEVAKRYGFGECSFEPHSENISKHYGSVHDVLQEYWQQGKVAISQEFKDKSTDGLLKWRDLAPSCLEWGIISMRKVEHMSDSDSNRS